MNEVCVLMSTYNGEKYVRDQINSVLNQKDIQIKLLIRDDGSNDDTRRILEQFDREYSNISVDFGENMGPAKSFLLLLKNAPKAEYYAFCDQDDIWDENKLSSAVRMISKRKRENVPVLYYSELNISDSNCKIIKTTTISKYKHGKYLSMVDNLATGCTMVFDYDLAKIANEAIPQNVTMHDAWINMVCSFFGDVIVDDNSYILYRQHSNNTIGMKTDESLFEKLRIHLRRLRDKELQPRYVNAANFLKIYEDRLSDIDREKVTKIVKYKNSFVDRVSLLFDFSIRSYSISKDLRYRVLILLGEI